jgi:hypothetical protein
MKRITVVCFSAFLTLLLSGCAAPRWQICRAEYSYRSNDDAEEEYVSGNTILLDTKTGMTWLMTPSDDEDAADFGWVKMREYSPSTNHQARSRQQIATSDQARRK